MLDLSGYLGHASAKARVWKGRGQLAEVHSLLPPCGFWGQGVRLGSECVYLLSHPTGPDAVFFRYITLPEAASKAIVGT